MQLQSNNFFKYNSLKLIFIFCMMLISGNVISQAKFIYSGKIEYERTANYAAIFGTSWQYYKDKIPQFKKQYFDYVFDKNQSVYKNGRTVDDEKYKAVGLVNDPEYYIYNNYDSGRTIATQKAFDEDYLLKDSILKIQWRITDETREIAGFDCRKAVGKVLDSIYVVAFYTEDIVPPGGPANFSGLPGMILGIGFPRMHYTLYATKLELTTITPADLKPPSKGEKTDRKTLITVLKNLSKSWGDQGPKYVLSMLF